MMSGFRRCLHGGIHMIGNANGQEPRWTWIPSRPSWPCTARTPPGMREAIVAFMAYNFARFFGGVDNEFRTVVAEGDVVVVEHRLSATLPDGRPYVNDYCF